MNANLAYTLDSHFGPPSGAISIAEFVEASSPAVRQNETTSENFTTEFVDECSVDDILDPLNEVWSDPALSAYIIRDHDRTVTTLHARTQKTPKNRKANNQFQPTPSEVSDVLQQKLEGISLDSFRLTTDAVHFLRTPKNSDQNTLETMKMSLGCGKTVDGPVALLIMSIHSKVSWSPSYVTRTSSHAFISSQTLYDVYASIPCATRSFPLDAWVEEYSHCAICVEGRVYSQEFSMGADYTSKLLQQIEISKKTPGTGSISKANTFLENTKLSSLSLRVNEPYWMIHQGNCEHFLVLDQIRALHPSDPRSGYPLTLYITPPILDLCRACSRVPAVWSVVGDIRLGESPCLLCAPCWRSMGVSDAREVVVLPLPNYEHFS